MITSIKLKKVIKRGRFDAETLIYKSSFLHDDKGDGWQGGGTYVNVYVVDKVFVILGGIMGNIPIAVCGSTEEYLINAIRKISRCDNITIEP